MPDSSARTDRAVVAAVLSIGATNSISGCAVARLEGNFKRESHGGVEKGI